MHGIVICILLRLARSYVKPAMQFRQGFGSSKHHMCNVSSVGSFTNTPTSHRVAETYTLYALLKQTRKSYQEGNSLSSLTLGPVLRVGLHCLPELFLLKTMHLTFRRTPDIQMSSLQPHWQDTRMASHLHISKRMLVRTKVGNNMPGAVWRS